MCFLLFESSMWSLLSLLKSKILNSLLDISTIYAVLGSFIRELVGWDGSQNMAVSYSLCFFVVLCASFRVCLTFSFGFLIFGAHSVVFLWFFPKDCLHEIQLCRLEKFSVVKCSHQSNLIMAMWQQDSGWISTWRSNAAGRAQNLHHCLNSVNPLEPG